MTSLAERSQIITLVQEAMNSGARQDRACTVINFNARTLCSAGRLISREAMNAPVGHKYRQSSSLCGGVNTYWRLPIRTNSVACHPVRSCRYWRIEESTSLLN